MTTFSKELCASLSTVALGASNAREAATLASKQQPENVAAWGMSHDNTIGAMDRGELLAFVVAALPGKGASLHSVIADYLQGRKHVPAARDFGNAMEAQGLAKSTAALRHYLREVIKGHPAPTTITKSETKDSVLLARVLTALEACDHVTGIADIVATVGSLESAARASERKAKAKPAAETPAPAPAPAPAPVTVQSAIPGFDMGALAAFMDARENALAERIIASVKVSRKPAK
jgi:hypothetical protein